MADQPQLPATGIAGGVEGPFDPNRYDGRMPYRRCGRSGLLLPAISRVEQLEENVRALAGSSFSSEELARIDAITPGG